MLVKEKRRRISPSPHMANYIKQIIFAFLLICNTFVTLDVLECICVNYHCQIFDGKKIRFYPNNLSKEVYMTKKLQPIISSKLFFGFCLIEFLILVALKVIQAIFPGPVVEVFPMFSAILLNAIFMLFLVFRVKKAGKDTLVKGLPFAVFTTLLADCFLVLLHGLSVGEVIHFISPLTVNMIGFAIFGIVQVIYACYLGLTRKRLIIRIGFYGALIIGIAVAGLFTFDRFIACLSMSQLVLNVIYSWIEHKKKHTTASLLLAIGITLFFGCDFSIMLRMLLPAQGFVYAAICS